ncbi:hypothetical protein [Thalassovita sp.]|jgi:hypothetical protein|uniref:hypothetical protein n=1 Tax=Thalassovita sp. TaxID=1979401 RepID=UPI003B5CAFD6
MFVAGLFYNLTDHLRTLGTVRGLDVPEHVANVTGDTPSNWRFVRHLFDNIRFYLGLAAVEETAFRLEWVKSRRILGGI